MCSGTQSALGDRDLTIISAGAAQSHKPLAGDRREAIQRTLRKQEQAQTEGAHKAPGPEFALGHNLLKPTDRNRTIAALSHAA